MDVYTPSLKKFGKFSLKIGGEIIFQSWPLFNLFSQLTHCALSDRVEIFLRCRWSPPQKNNFYVTGAIHCQNGIWNLLILFLYFFHAWNIWCCLMCSTRPHNFIHILPAELQLTCCKFSCCSRLSSTRTQISFKSAGVFV